MWPSSEESVAKVENGTVTALSEGKTTISVTSTVNPDIKATCEITVTAKRTPTVPYDEHSGFGGNKPSYDPYDTNKDGVVTCKEKFGSGWIWSEDHKACIRQEWIIVDTSVK